MEIHILLLRVFLEYTQDVDDPAGYIPCSEMIIKIDLN